jgi:hypothetical protein
MRSSLLCVFAVAVLLGCATMVPAPAGSDSSVIVGELRANVSGMGTATNGASGWITTEQPLAAALILHNEASGKDYEIRTRTPGKFFILANAEPGRYSLLGLWAQVNTDNACVTVTSHFYKALEFEVKPGSVVNLGVNDWRFSFDLTRSASANSFVLNADFPAVEKAFSMSDARSQWKGYQDDHTVFAGETSARPSAEALPPRNPNNNPIWVLQ